MAPLLSIIIPTYNAEKFISESIRSVLLQTFASFELLIIDGGSTDLTKNIVLDYANNDTRISWSSEKDAGIYDAMNKGVTKARGEWIYFMGSDDRFFNNEVLNTVFKSEERLTSEIIYGDVFSSMFKGRYAGEFSASKLLHQNICHQSIFYKREVFYIIGKFSLTYKLLADWEHNIRWFFNKNIKHTYVDLVICSYAADGRSSVITDDIFLEKKQSLFLRHGYTSIDKNFRKEILNNLICSGRLTFLQKLYYQFLFHLNTM